MDKLENLPKMEKHTFKSFLNKISDLGFIVEFYCVNFIHFFQKIQRKILVDETNIG
jgi:site-specific DNA-cytosine methylase